MDGLGFDLWTRRRFGQAAGGFVASTLAALGLPNTEASKKKRKRRKKRCKRHLQTCRQGGKRKCCGQLRCRTTAANSGVHTFCCKTEGKSCDPEGSSFQCCGDLFCCETSGTCAFTCVS